MLEAGMNIARFKSSSITQGDKIRLLGKIEKAADACCDKYDVNTWPIASCIALTTCIAKTGLLENVRHLPLYCDVYLVRAVCKNVMFYEIGPMCVLKY